MTKKQFPTKWDFRDVSSGFQKLREILLGRKYLPHNRFPPLISPRSIPPPDIPRAPEYKYSDQWYGNRDVLDSVKPPVVAPVGVGLRRKPNTTSRRAKCGGKSTESADGLKFPCPPTPGMPWWFDGHSYFIQVPDVSKPPSAPPYSSKCAPTVCEKPPPTPPCPVPPRKHPCPPPEQEASPCADPNPCKLAPCEKKDKTPPPPPPPPPKPCDPCRPPGGEKR